MRVCLLDAAPYQHQTAAAVRRALLDRAALAGGTPRTFYLPDIAIADCAGDFNCWLKSPGVCSINDGNRDIARGVVQNDVLAVLTPVTFGGYSSELKKGLDHIIQIISPFFETVEGETHHRKRYDRNPTLVGLGLMDAPDETAARIFRTLVARNALNLQNERHASGVLHPGMGQDGIAAEVVRLLDCTDSVRHDTDLEIGPRAEEWQAALPAPKTALVLVGSPRGAHSTSASLGRYLGAGLDARGVRTDTIEIYAAQRTAEADARLLAAADAADLVVLSCPLYVDSLPAPVIRVLERISAHRRAAGAPPRPESQRFSAIVQCGFPEVRHNYTGLAICRQFAREAGFTWAGGLPLGGGHGLVQSKPLESLGGRAAHLRKALDLTAAALAGGGPVPDEAVTLLARPFVPSWIYRAMGNLGWQIDARRRGIADRLRDQPYPTS